MEKKIDLDALEDEIVAVVQRARAAGDTDTVDAVLSAMRLGLVLADLKQHLEQVIAMFDHIIEDLGEEPNPPADTLVEGGEA